MYKQYPPLPSYAYPPRRNRGWLVGLVLGVGLVLLLAGSGGIDLGSLKLTITNSTSTGSGFTTSEVSEVGLGVINAISNGLLKVISGLAGFILSGSKLEVLGKTVTTAIVFFGLAYLVNLLKYLLYGLAIFCVIIGIMGVLGAI